MKKPTVLIIEDDTDIREALGDLVSSEGYDVVTAKDGLGGIAVLQAAGRPTLILLDLKMPNFDGNQFMTTIKSLENLKTIPVIVLSAGKPAPKTAAVADEVLRKPVDVETICELIRKYCA